MAIVAVTTSPTTLDAGTSEFVTVANTGAVDVTVVRGSQSFVLRPTQSRTVYPEGSAVTASVVSGSGQVSTAARAAQVTQAQQVAANTAAIAGLPGTYASLSGVAAGTATLRTPPVPGVPFSDGCFGMIPYPLGVQSTAGTSRTTHYSAFQGTDIRLVYVNFGNNGTAVGPNLNDADGAAALPIKASVDYSGTIYPVTFKGALSVTIDPGGYVVSDPLPIEIPAQTTFSVRTYTSSTSWYPTRKSGHSSGTGGFTATTDLTAAGSAAINDAIASLLGPSAITAVPKSTGVRSVAVLGDSLAAGKADETTAGSGDWEVYSSGDPTVGGGGFVVRALRGNYGFINFAMSGDTVAGYVATTGHFRRTALLPQCSDLLCEYGRNDVGSTLASIQANLVKAWKYAAWRGVRAWQTTITPKSTSTDGWATTANQTADSATNSTRTALNDWIRDGAPLDNATSLTAVATGTTGALRAGSTGHPLYGYFEVADLAESARNSGLWKPALRVVSDAAMTSGSGVLTSATAAFTSADYGRYVAVSGAGSAGGVYIAQISTFTSATQVTCRVNASTTVTGAACGVGIYTGDGLHPTPQGATSLAAAIGATAFG